MEVSPKLFDECTNNYKQSRTVERIKLKEREDSWRVLEGMASDNALKLKTTIPELKALPIPILSFSSQEVDMDGEKVEEDVETAENGQNSDEQGDLLHSEMETFPDRPETQRFRRKSVLPVDETVLSELSRHRSLEEVIKKD